jgi:NADH dehydrogenase
VGHSAVVLASGETIAAANVIWVAGVRGEPLGETLSHELAAQGRVPVLPTMQIPGSLDAFVIGDLAYLEDPQGRAYPMVAPVAIQEAQLVAENIMRELRGEELRTFKYRDRGQMATIGRRKAVAHVFGLQFSGFIAWSLWLFVHLIQIVSLRNRALVLVNWIWNYFRYDRANRLVTDDEPIAPNPGDRRAGSEDHEHAPVPHR